MPDSGQWRVLSKIVTDKFPNARISSTYRPGSLGSNGGADYHSKGDAVDIRSPNMEIFNWLVAAYPGSAEIIYTPGGDRQIKDGKPHRYSAGVAVGHFDHIHWAMPAGTSNAVNASAPTTGGIGSVVSTFTGITDFLSFVTDPGLWMRVAAAIGGAFLLLIGAIRLTGINPLSVTPVGKAGKLLKAVI